MQEKIYPPKVTIRHSQNSWQYFYFVVGVALGIELGIVAMLPLTFAWNVIFFLVIGGATTYYLIGNGWVQRKLLLWEVSHRKSLVLMGTVTGRRSVVSLTDL
jgi:hypothetical protein